MSFRITLNKSKSISFRVNPYSSSIKFTLVLPGVTTSLSVKRLKKKSIAKLDKSHTSHNRISNAMLHQLQPREYRSHINKLSRLIKLKTLSNWLIISLLLSLLPIVMIKLPGSIIFILTGLMGIILKVYVHTIGRLRYDTISNSKELPAIWSKLATADKLWHVVGSTILDEKEVKSHGGNTVQYERIPTKVRYKSPSYIRTNSDVLQIRLEKETLVILPDHYFLISKSKVGIIETPNLAIIAKAIPYGENEAVPKDAKVLQTTWRYLNKDGSKDKRYKENQQIPICEYGLVSLKTDLGFEILLLSSKTTLNQSLVFKYKKTL